MADHPSTAQRLRGFIDAILLEQRRYQLWDEVLDQDYLDLQSYHARKAELLNNNEHHVRLCRAHEAVFENHRKLQKAHTGMANHCLQLINRLKVETLTEDEMIREIEELSKMYDLMRLQHMKMDRERRQILAEHRDFVRNRPNNSAVN